MNIPDFPLFLCNEHSCVSTFRLSLLGRASTELCVILEEGCTAPTNRQTKSFDRLSEYPASDLIEDIRDRAKIYCKKVDDGICLANGGISIDLENIENYYSINDITVPALGESPTDILFVNMDCEWEEEHGMQAILVDNSVVYCGPHTTIFYSSAWRHIISSISKDKLMEILRSELIRISSNESWIF